MGVEMGGAEIRWLPVRSYGPEQIARLYADLTAAHARGEPLGSRVPHIQAGGEQLAELSRELENMIDGLEETLIRLGLHDPAASEALRRLLGYVRGLADTAQQYSPTPKRDRA